MPSLKYKRDQCDNELINIQIAYVREMLKSSQTPSDLKEGLPLRLNKTGFLLLD